MCCDVLLDWGRDQTICYGDYILVCPMTKTAIFCKSFKVIHWFYICVILCHQPAQLGSKQTCFEQRYYLLKFCSNI